MRLVETSGSVRGKGHQMSLAERMIQRPRDIVRQALGSHLVVHGVLAAKLRIAFEVFAHLGRTLMNFVCRTADVFGSSPDIVIDSRNLGFAHALGPDHPGAEPLRMMDQEMKRRP